MTYICYSTFAKEFEIAENENEFVSHLGVKILRHLGSFCDLWTFPCALTCERLKY